MTTTRTRKPKAEQPEQTQLAVIEQPRPVESTISQSVTETTVAELKTNLSTVKLAGVSFTDGKVIVSDADAMLADKTGLKVVRESRNRARNARTTCVKEHLAARDYHNKEAKRIIAQEKELVKRIEEIELPLVALEQAVEDELDRRQKAAADALYTARRNLLLEVAGPDFGSVDEQLLRSITDDDAFMRLKEQCLDNKRRHEEAEAERQRLAAEQARIAEENRIAADKLAEERRKFEAEQAEIAQWRKIEDDRLAIKRAEQLQAENDRLAAERKKFADEQAEAARVRQAEQDRLDAERKEQAEKDRVSREAIEAERRSLEEERQRLADEARDREEEKKRSEEQETELRNSLISFAEPSAPLTPEFIAAADIESSTPITIGASPTDADLIDAAEETARRNSPQWVWDAANLIMGEFESGRLNTDCIVEIINREFEKAELY